ARRDAQHRALPEQVDVAADEGLGIGTQQGQHHLVETVATAGRQRGGDLAQGLAALDRSVFAARGGNRAGGGRPRRRRRGLDRRGLRRRYGFFRRDPGGFLRRVV